MNKKIIIISGILIILILIAGLITLNLLNKKDNEDTNNKGSETMDYTNEETKINIEADGIIITATLDDSETAKEFISLLPLEINMTNFYDREYAGGLNKELSTNGNKIDTFTNGDVTYYTAGKALAIFYDKDDSSTQGDLIKIGEITSPLDDFKKLSDATTFRISLSDTTSEEEIVLNRYKEMEQAMIDKDIDKLDEIVKDGTTFTHMSGKTQTKEEYFADIKNGDLDYQSYTIENPKVTINGNEATLTAKVTLTANAYGAQGSWPFNINAHFEKINGTWYYGK